MSSIHSCIHTSSLVNIDISRQLVTTPSLLLSPYTVRLSLLHECKVTNSETSEKPNYIHWQSSLHPHSIPRLADRRELWWGMSRNTTLVPLLLPTMLLLLLLTTRITFKELLISEVEERHSLPVYLFSDNFNFNFKNDSLNFKIQPT